MLILWLGYPAIMLFLGKDDQLVPYAVTLTSIFLIYNLIGNQIDISKNKSIEILGVRINKNSLLLIAALAVFGVIYDSDIRDIADFFLLALLLFFWYQYINWRIERG